MSTPRLPSFCMMPFIIFAPYLKYQKWKIFKQYFPECVNIALAQKLTGRYIFLLSLTSSISTRDQHQSSPYTAHCQSEGWGGEDKKYHQLGDIVLMYNQILITNFKRATSRMAHIEKNCNFFQVCHSQSVLTHWLLNRP